MGVIKPLPLSLLYLYQQDANTISIAVLVSAAIQVDQGELAQLHVNTSQEHKGIYYLLRSH